MVFTALSTDGGRTAHPVHLHGHSFYILDVGYASDGVITCGETNSICSPSLDMLKQRLRGSPFIDADFRILNNSVLKDTILVPGGGYAVIAFKANNPGHWFLHCHIEKHLTEGMGLIVSVRPNAEHTCPPYGINDGSLTWSVQDYQSFVSNSIKCDHSQCIRNSGVDNTGGGNRGGGNRGGGGRSGSNGATAGTGAVSMVITVAGFLSLIVVV